MHLNGFFSLRHSLRRPTPGLQDSRTPGNNNKWEESFHFLGIFWRAAAARKYLPHFLCDHKIYIEWETGSGSGICYAISVINLTASKYLIWFPTSSLPHPPSSPQYWQLIKWQFSVSAFQLKLLSPDFYINIYLFYNYFCLKFKARKQQGVWVIRESFLTNFINNSKKFKTRK